jgi:hypothetical protein
MNKLCLLSCLALAVSASAQTAPKVVFTGDTFMYNWQQSVAFKANKNWIGAALNSFGSTFFESTYVAADFQTVLNQHPDFVFIETGSSDVFWQIDSTPLGAEWPDAARSIVQMVNMAQKAGVKVILGNIPIPGFTGDYFNSWLQTYTQTVNIPIVNLEYWLQNGCSGVSPCADTLATVTEPALFAPTDAGYQFITQLAQTAIATYSLKIKGGYLANVTTNPTNFQPRQPQVNTVATGASVQFTPQATWTDGVTRPMQNTPSGGTLGTWWSTNPGVMSVNQQGLAYAYNPGTAQIWFKSASGNTFSPWTMNIGPVNQYANYPPPY